MTSPEQHPAPDPDPRDEAEEQVPQDEMTPAPDEATPIDETPPEGAPLTDADMPDAPLPLAPDEAAIPESDRAPGVVRETPVGGKLPPDRPAPEPREPAESPVRDMPALENLAAQPEPETPPAPEEELVPPNTEDVTGTAPADEAPGMEAPSVDALAGEAAPEPAAPEPAAPLAEATQPPAADEPAPTASSLASPDDWGEELSPELAALLFGGASAAAAAAETEKEDTAETATPAPAAEEQPVTAAAPAEAAPAARPVTEAARPHTPATVTTAAEARSQPITAGPLAAPPPGAPVKGETRYVRVEEPLRGNKGRRILEEWEYFGPDYPALEGLLVKRVKTEEITYADGSWKLTFRRDYSEGRDERTIRIASDGEYSERTDRVHRRDATSGKMRREREQVYLRYAAPLREEKRGLLSGLFGRGNGPQQEGPKRWRPASDSEQRDARQTGGEALKFGLFERR